MTVINPLRLTDKELIKELELRTSYDPYLLELVNRFNNANLYRFNLKPAELAHLSEFTDPYGDTEDGYLTYLNL